MFCNLSASEKSVGPHQKHSNTDRRLQLHEPRLVELLSAAVRSGAQVFFFVCGDRASGVDCVHNTLYDGIVIQL